MGASAGVPIQYILYPLAFLFIIGIVVGAFINPFIDEGMSISYYNSSLVDGLHNLAIYGVPFNITISLPLVPDVNLGSIMNLPYTIIATLVPSIPTFLADKVDTLYYIPIEIQAPITILIYISLITSFIILYQNFIP